MITLTKALIIFHITKTESDNCFIIDFKSKMVNMAPKTIKNKPQTQQIVHLIFYHFLRTKCSESLPS